MINAFWMLSPNFGDALTPYIIQKLSGEFPVYTEPDDGDNYIVTGSILNHAAENSIVWGAGIANEEDIIPECDIRAVRGKLLLERVQDEGYDIESFGDPALLLPKFYNPIIEKKYKYGVIPHYVDLHKLSSGDKYYKVINILKPVEEVVNDLLECEMILSSSLHGLIVADAYGIPNLWVEFSDKILGDGFKFRDYFSSVGRQGYEPFDLRSLKEIGDVFKQIEPFNIEFNHQQLIESCPFNYRF